MYSHNPKLSKAIEDICRNSVYPSSAQMLSDRLRPEFGDIPESFLLSRIQLFVGPGIALLETVSSYAKHFPHEILDLIVQYRGKDIVLVQHPPHEKYPRIL